MAARRSHRKVAAFALILGLLSLGAVASAQAPQMAKASHPAVAAPARPAAVPSSADVPSDYILGPTDVLGIDFRDEKDMSSDVTIRPDGKITLPLINDVVAGGFTAEQLRLRLTEIAKQFVKSPVVTVVVKQVNNNRVFITGQVLRSGPYVLSGPTTVLQVIAMAGGFTEFADKNHILITRIENGVQRAIRFNYDDVVKRQDLSKNVFLKVGDTVVVP